MCFSRDACFRRTSGYYVKVVIVEVVIVNLGKHQLPMKCLRLAATSHTANHMFFKHASKKRLGYNHPGYDHLCVVLDESSTHVRSLAGKRERGVQCGLMMPVKSEYEMVRKERWIGSNLQRLQTSHTSPSPLASKVAKNFSAAYRALCCNAATR